MEVIMIKINNISFHERLMFVIMFITRAAGSL